MDLLRKPTWSPYLVGTLLGLLTWFAFSVPRKTLGVSTNFSQAVRFAEEVIAPDHVSACVYFTDYKIPKSIGWEAMLAVGMLLGGTACAMLSGVRAPLTPELWTKRFGPSRMKALAGAFVGGALIAYGARLAGGCTSGHGISGTLQLAGSSWGFFVALFASGLLTAFVLYRKVA